MAHFRNILHFHIFRFVDFRVEITENVFSLLEGLLLAGQILQFISCYIATPKGIIQTLVTFVVVLHITLRCTRT